MISGYNGKWTFHMKKKSIILPSDVVILDLVTEGK
jgi:hypothetical protein